MKKARVLVFILIFAVGCYGPAHAASPVDVHVAVGKVSEVVFPEKVAKVIKGGAADSVLVETLDNSIYLLPKTNTPADVFVTVVSGVSYPLNLVIAPEHDLRVEVDASSSSGRLSSEVKTNAMDLMKEILLGHKPVGATMVKGGQSVTLQDGQIKLTVEVIYDFPHLAAYIVQAQNLTDNSVIVPVGQMTFPNVLAVTSDQDMLKPKGQEGDAAKVYMIAGK